MGSNTRMARLKEQRKPDKPLQKPPTTFAWASDLNAILILDSSFTAILGTSNNPADIAVTCDVSGIAFHRTKTEIIAQCPSAKSDTNYLPATVSISPKERSHIIFLYA